MKTREKLIADFQQKFNKERKIRIWKLSFQIPFWIIINSVLLFAIFGTIYLSITEHNGLFLISILITLGCLVINYAELGSFFEIFNSIEKGGKVKRLLDGVKKEKEEWFEKRQLIEPVCDGGTLEKWMKLAIEYQSSDQYEISELILQEGKELEDKILELESQLEVYENCPEKNFWQYFKSKK